jgi:hypothetical protein
LKNIRKEYKKKSSSTEELVLEESVLEELIYQDIHSIINTMIDSYAIVPATVADTEPATELVTEPATELVTEPATELVTKPVTEPAAVGGPPASLPVGGPLASLAAATRAFFDQFRRTAPKEVVIKGDKFRPSDSTSSGRNSYDSNGEYPENGGSKKNKKRKTRKNINKKRRIRKTTIKKALKNRNNKKTHKNAYKKRNLNKYRRIKKTKKKIQQTD